MRDAEFNKRISSMKFARPLALIGVILIICLLIATFITGITGSKYFYPCLFLSMIVPFLMYVMLWIAKLLFNSSMDRQLRESEASDEEKD